MFIALKAGHVLQLRVFFTAQTCHDFTNGLHVLHKHWLRHGLGFLVQPVGGQLPCAICQQPTGLAFDHTGQQHQDFIRKRVLMRKYGPANSLNLRTEQSDNSALWDSQLPIRFTLRRSPSMTSG